MYILHIEIYKYNFINIYGGVFHLKNSPKTIIGIDNDVDGGTE